MEGLRNFDGWTGACKIRSWDNCKSLLGDANRRTWREWQKMGKTRVEMNTLWKLVYSNNGYPGFQSGFLFLPKNFPEIQGEAASGTSIIMIFISMPTQLQYFWTVHVTPEGTGAPKFRSLLRVLDDPVIDCFHASLPIARNAKYW